MKEFEYREDTELVEGLRVVLRDLPPPSREVLEAIHAEAAARAKLRQADKEGASSLYRRLAAMVGGLAAAAVLIFAVNYNSQPPALENGEEIVTQDGEIWNDALALVALDENDEIMSGDDEFCEALLRFQERPGFFDLAGDTYAIH